jgi:hypothetical protein
MDLVDGWVRHIMNLTPFPIWRRIAYSAVKKHGNGERWKGARVDGAKAK